MNEILAPKLVGLDVTDQAKIDKLMVEEILGLHEKLSVALSEGTMIKIQGCPQSKVHTPKKKHRIISYCNGWPPLEAHVGVF